MLTRVVVGALIAAGGLIGYRLRRAIKENDRLRSRLETASMELERLQESCARLAPADVVERVAAGGLSVEGERKEATVLFVDLVGFTALSEQVEPPVLVRILNGYFERMSRAITDHRGHVSTFLGDGVLALFGALRPNPWQANDAVHAALAMRAGIVEFNRELESEALPALSIGVGLHRGVGVAGLISSETLLEYAFVGRIVNVAARVQDLTRSHRVDILITEEVRKSLDPRFELRPLPPSEIRGVELPVATYAVEKFVGATRAGSH